MAGFQVSTNGRFWVSTEARVVVVLLRVGGAARLVDVDAGGGFIPARAGPPLLHLAQLHELPVYPRPRGGNVAVGR